MTQVLPKVLPVNELKNTANIMKTCQESPVPIVITRNGYGEAVMMSIALFEELFAKVQAAALINEGIDEIKKGAKGMYGDEFFNRMNKKHGK
jgi:prevent-host-death family protein